ncbi:MAG: hypothetical protein AAB116_06625, partial [Candidatus Poribacteria bacterium]
SVVSFYYGSYLITGSSFKTALSSFNALSSTNLLGVFNKSEKLKNILIFSFKDDMLIIVISFCSSLYNSKTNGSLAANMKAKNHRQ